RAQFDPGEADAVVLASRDGYADALVGVPLAVAKNAPILLSGANALGDATTAEIDRVTGGGSTGKTVYLLGGVFAIGDDVAAALRAQGYNVVRYAGASRYETAVSVANALGEPTTIVEATGASFADALTGGAAAAHAQGVVLLTAGDQLPAATAGYLADHGSVARVAVGGAA